MKENPLSKRLHLSSIPIRLGLPLALGVVAVLLLVGLGSAVGPSATLADPPGPGDLDTTFGNSGVVTTAIGPIHDYGDAVAIQPDGRIVVAGYVYSGSDFDFALVRYTLSGAPDATFGTTGVVTTPIGPGNDYGRDVAIQEDGKIVVAGYAWSGSDYDFALVRYTVSGALDTTFGATGVVITPVGPGNDFAHGVAIQPDGRIVAAGCASIGFCDFALVRYTVSGTLDTSLGTSGVVITPIGPGVDFARGVAIQPDGRIVAAGEAWSGSDDDFAVVRYTVSGALDSTFGATGVVTTHIGPGRDASFGVAIQPDGKIVVAGYAHSGSDNDIAVARYTVYGTPDITFGNSGVVTTSIGPANDHAYDVAIQEDGRIVAAGSASNGSASDIAVVRYTVSGTPDTTFGTGSVVTTPIGPGGDRAYGVAIQEDGKIVAAGDVWSGSDYDFALVRYHAENCYIYLPLVFRKS